MTPKEKAVELVAKMNNAPINIIEWYKASDYAKNELKRKALIVVDEILQYDIRAKCESQFVIQERIEEYWKQVKTEIEKL